MQNTTRGEGCQDNYIGAMWRRLGRCGEGWGDVEIEGSRRFTSLFHKLVLLVLEDLGGGFGIIEEFVDLLHLLPLHSFLPLDSA
ncbi:hypothetical protein DPEC_G00212600 [Dallia pectoralis]|uniref:Uncharacterized protein n=1 Tax=Dallia pectoralis TaxID=75939 RepID=A0ACC2G6S6_DALPE|nr:hypothetical protein DPEC_G00212600 [Dallia pectoralis]